MNMFCLLSDSLDTHQFSEFLFYTVFYGCHRVSLRIPGCPGVHYIDETALKLTEISLPLPPDCWD